MDDPLVRLVSIMDHTPGQRQFVNVEKYRFYYMKKYGMSDAEFEAFLARRRDDQAKYSVTHRREILARARERQHILASHDDAAAGEERLDRKSTRLNSSHQIISYAVFCLKKKK